MNENILFSISYGLYVITAEQYKDNGCVVNTVVQVANNPTRLSVAVSNSNLTCGMIEETRRFNVNILSKSAPFELFKRFGFQSGRSADKFDGIDFKRSKNGLAYLPEHSLGYISCEVASVTDLGSHKLFIAEVTDEAVLASGEPVTYSYYQSNIKPKSDAPKKSGYICKVCGYVYEGDELPPDFICPICKHPASDFEKVQ